MLNNLLSNTLLATNRYVAIIFAIGLLLLIISIPLTIKFKRRWLLVISVFILLFATSLLIFSFFNVLMTDAILYSIVIALFLIIVVYYGLILPFTTPVTTDDLLVGQEGIVKTLELSEGYVTGKLNVNLKNDYVIQKNYLYDADDFERLGKNEHVFIDDVAEDGTVHITKLAQANVLYGNEPKVERNIASTNQNNRVQSKKQHNLFE